MIFEKSLEKTLETYEKWWNGELDRPLIPVVLTGHDPGREPPKHYYSHQNGFANPDISPEDFVDGVDYSLRSQEFIGDSYPLFNTMFTGPGAMAAFLGAEVNIVSGSIWFKVKEKLPINELHFEYKEDNFWYLRIKAIMKEAKRRWGDSVIIGRPDLGGVMDILASFRGTENLLADLFDSPDEVKRAVNEIKTLWFRYYDELSEYMTDGYYTDWSSILSVKCSYMMQSDFAYMISPEMFSEFVLGELTETCAFLDRGCYHLDGIGQIPFLDGLINEAKMDLIQWVPGDGPYAEKDWFDLYCKVLDAGKHLQITYDREFKALDKLISHYGTGKNIVMGTKYIPASNRTEAIKLLERYGVE